MKQYTAEQHSQSQIIKQSTGQLTSIDFHQEHWCDVDGLDVEELHGVDGGDGECGGLFVSVVQLVEMLTYQVN